jgi:signal transduction histidine kinase
MKPLWKTEYLRSRLRPYAKLHIALAAGVFVISFVISLYYWNNVRASIQLDQHSTFERQQHAYETAVTKRMQQYEQFIRGANGLFVVKPGLSQADWAAYFQPYQVPSVYPEVQGIGFTRYLTKDAVSAYVDTMHAQGQPDFHIYPAGDRDAYAAVTFNARFNDTNNNGTSLGYDPLTSPIRCDAMMAAARSGNPQSSGLLTLVSDPRPNYTAFIMYLPVYMPGKPLDTPDQRMTALYGFSYVAVDMTRMLDDLQTQAGNNLQVVAHVEDADAAIKNLSYENAGFGQTIKASGTMQNMHNVVFYGHAWQITFAAGPDIIPKPERQLPVQAMERALFSSLLFAVLALYIMTSRERKYARQKQREVQIAKDDLLSLASHQLRTPATVVKQYIGMLQQGYAGKLTRKQKDMLTRAYESNERQLEVINQLLYVARLDAGRLRLRRERVDIGVLVRSVLADYAHTLAEHGHTLASELPPIRSVMARIDPRFMRMVIENLLSNAVKYTPQGGAIGVSVHRDIGYRNNTHIQGFS